MPLDGHSYLVSQGWGGKGTGLRQGAISRPIAIAQKKNLAGLGKDRDEAFPFWDHLFSAAASSIKLRINDSDDENTSNDDGQNEGGNVNVLKRTETGIISNRRPIEGTPATSGSSTPDVVETGPRYTLLAKAKRESARRGLYSRFFRGPTLGPDTSLERGIAESSPSPRYPAEDDSGPSKAAALAHDFNSSIDGMLPKKRTQLKTSSEDEAKKKRKEERKREKKKEKPMKDGDKADSEKKKTKEHEEKKEKKEGKEKKKEKKDGGKTKENRKKSEETVVEGSKEKVKKEKKSKRKSSKDAVKEVPELCPPSEDVQTQAQLGASEKKRQKAYRKRKRAHSSKDAETFLANDPEPKYKKKKCIEDDETRPKKKKKWKQDSSDPE